MVSPICSIVCDIASVGYKCVPMEHGCIHGIQCKFVHLDEGFFFVRSLCLTRQNALHLDLQVEAVGDVLMVRTWFT